MVTEVRAPSAATAGARLSIGRWFKRVGDPVSRDEPLVEIDSDGLTGEVCAPATGVLTTILLKDGQSVEPGALLGDISQF